VSWDLLVLAAPPGAPMESLTEENTPPLGVRAQGGDEAAEVVVRLCAQAGWRALDISTGAFLDETSDPATGLRGWRAFRDSVVDD
jgi:hypothetical protein